MEELRQLRDAKHKHVQKIKTKQRGKNEGFLLSFVI